jgi:Na+/H+ antiporter NhaD/arsenite permease-like protein
MSNDSAARSGGDKLVLVAIGLTVVLYLASAAARLPQKGTEMTNGPAEHHVAEPGHKDPVKPDEKHAGHVPAGEEHVDKNPPPPYWTVVPFCLLLAAIAILPLSHKTGHWWESNLHKFYVAGGLAIVTLAYYGLMHHHPIDRHFLGHAVIEPSAGGVSWGLISTTLQNAILHEFVPFIILLFALYTISGGIRIAGDLPAHSMTNSIFLAVGAVLASFIGTTGAAMLLIRPLLETNSQRKHVAHTVIFFIFIVCNCGGCLLPLGDPPLFLGYLKGVDFLWTLKLWKEWMLVNAALVAIYYVWDRVFCYPKEAKDDLVVDELRVKGLKFSGVWPNALLLLGVVVAVAMLDPGKTLPGTNWHPWLYLREIVLLALVGLSLALGSSEVRNNNKFNYGAIVEVAALFFGIFICMKPALQILDVQGPTLGIDTPAKFFWVTGALSSVLDNAPTYLVFFETAKTLTLEPGTPTMAEVGVNLLAAISLGAVFMGANTYIGNGPNFMVKAIAESSGVKMPSFFGYMVYSGGILIPLFILVTLLFFRQG